MARQFFLEPLSGQTNTKTQTATQPVKKKFFLEPISDQTQSPVNQPSFQDPLDLTNIITGVQSGLNQAGDFFTNTVAPKANRLSDRLINSFDNFQPGPIGFTPGVVNTPAITPEPSKPIQAFTPRTTFNQPVPSTIQPTLTPTTREPEAGPISTVDVSQFDPALVQKVDTTADRTGIPRDIFRGLVKRESAFNPNAKGSLDEVGLTQIRPSTFNFVLPGGNIRDIDQNLQAGAEFLKQQHESALSKGYTGIEAWKFAASAYNGGPGNLNKAIKKAQRISGSQTPSFKQVAPHLDKRAVDYAETVANTLSLQSDEERARKFGVIRQDKAPTVKDNILDSFRATGQGFAEITAVYGHLLDKIGNPIGKYVRDLGKREVESLQESFNPENLEALNEPALISTGPGTFDLKLNPKLSKRAIYFKTLAEFLRWLAQFFLLKIPSGQQVHQTVFSQNPGHRPFRFRLFSQILHRQEVEPFRQLAIRLFF